MTNGEGALRVPPWMIGLFGILTPLLSGFLAYETTRYASDQVMGNRLTSLESWSGALRDRIGVLEAQVRKDELESQQHLDALKDGILTRIDSAETARSARTDALTTQIARLAEQVAVLNDRAAGSGRSYQPTEPRR